MILPLSVSLLAFFVCLLTGFIVYSSSSRKLEHKLFLALCFVNAWMSLSEFLFIQSTASPLTIFWGRAYLAPGLAVSVALHFILVLTGNNIAKKKWFLGIIYFPNILYYLFTVTTDKIVTGVVSGRWGNEVVYSIKPSILSLGAIWITLLGCLSYIIPLVYFYKEKEKKKKRQFLYIFLGFFLPTVLGTLTLTVMPSAGINIPKLPSIYTMLQEILLGYAVWKFGLLDLNPATAANNIIETMNEMLIIIDREKRVVSYNSALLRLFQYHEEHIRDKSVTNLFPGRFLYDLLAEMDSSEGHQIHSGSPENSSVSHVEDALTTKNGKTVPVNISVSMLYERDGGKAGYVLVARDITKEKTAEAEKEKLIADLREAMDNVKTLRGLIPICARCKKIRDDKGFWNQIEKYISAHSEALFTHGICPECAEKLYGDEEWYREEE